MYKSPACGHDFPCTETYCIWGWKPKKQKQLKLWNGRGVDNKDHLYLAAYSKADACRMLNEIYPWVSTSQWNREITVYFSFNCWGSSMEGISPERGVWLHTDHWNNKDAPKRIYPVVK